MKRFYAAFIGCLLAVLSATGVFSAAAEEASTIPSDALVVAYDFEGTSLAVQLRDKAPAGTVADDLQIKGNVTVENGVATAGAAQNDDYLFASKSGDLMNLTEYTVYVKLQASGAYPGDWADFINIPGVMRAFINGQGESGYTVQARHRGSAGHAWTNGSFAFPENSYRWVAYTARLDADSQTVALISYYSEDGVRFVSSAKDRAETAASFSSTSNLNLAMSTQNGISYAFDDVMIFNRALDAEEVAALPGFRISQDRVGYLGCQDAGVQDGSIDIRFLAAIDRLDYDEVGFELRVCADGVDRMIRHACTTVYDSVIGLGKTVTAAELGGKYLFALGIRGLPVWSGSTELTVTPYYISEGETVRCAAVRVTYENGSFASASYVSD